MPRYAILIDEKELPEVMEANLCAGDEIAAMGVLPSMDGAVEVRPLLG
ncbi:MAG: hypothetical protein ACJ73S_24345 [Mycobacteriales bacterium]